MIASPATAALIETNNAGKLEIWGPQLGDQAPSSIVVPEAVTGRFKVAGHEAEFLGLGSDPDHSVLWFPEHHTSVGGVYQGQGTLRPAS